MSFLRLSATACLWTLALLCVTTAMTSVSALQLAPTASAMAWAIANLIEFSLSPAGTE